MPAHGPTAAGRPTGPSRLIVLCTSFDRADGVFGNHRAMPLRYRMLMWCAIPVVAVAQFFGGTRRLLSPEVELNDMPSAKDEMYSDGEFADHFERKISARTSEVKEP